MIGDLIALLNLAVEVKPAFGDKCNHCGYCCLTEVCSVGAELLGSNIGPCKYLVGMDKEQKHYDPSKHYCTLVINIPELAKEIGAGVGCCAETQAETLARITA